MSAAVVPFTGKAQPRFERSPATMRADDRATRDAYLIGEAVAGDNWHGEAFMALLKVLDENQQRNLTAVLTMRGIWNPHAETAAAMARQVTGTSEHKAKVADLICRAGRRRRN